MKAPYATIIIPTHDRAETLPYSLLSAAQQSVSDIEVLIVGDGCTAEVRHAAGLFVKQDKRFRFLDLPKAPLRGAANRHIAVLQAKSERIFYNDDDDLLLERHVDILGRALDDADIVDTPAAAVWPGGQIALGLQDSAHPTLRQMLVARQYKGVFDTHMAHRKPAYEAGAGAWLQAKDRRVVYSMLGDFAGDPKTRWRTRQRITALSFNGITRLGMPGQERARELASWSAKLSEEGTEAEIRKSGSYAFFTFMLMRALVSSGYRESAEVVAQLRAAIEDQLDSVQAETIDAVVALCRGIKPDDGAAQRALDDLLDARLGPLFSTQSVVDTFLQVFTPADVVRMLDACKTRPSVALGKFHVGAQARTLNAETIAAVETAMDNSVAWERFFFGFAVARGFRRARQVDLAWQWLERILPQVPDSFAAQSYWQLRSAIAAKTGRHAEAERARQIMLQVAEQMT